VATLTHFSPKTSIASAWKAGEAVVKGSMKIVNKAGEKVQLIKKGPETEEDIAFEALRHLEKTQAARAYAGDSWNLIDILNFVLFAMIIVAVVLARRNLRAAIAHVNGLFAHAAPNDYAALCAQWAGHREQQVGGSGGSFEPPG
jgi:hypothetical protein